MHNIAIELVNPPDIVEGHGQQSLPGALAQIAVGSAFQPSSVTAGSSSAGTATGGGGSISSVGGTAAGGAP